MVNTLIRLALVALFSFLVHDIQLIVGGKHKKFKFSIDDWVFAALNIYLDILNIFLQLLGSSNSQNN